LTVTLLGGQTIQVTVDVPPGTPLSQIHLPNISAPIVGISEDTPPAPPTTTPSTPAPAPNAPAPSSSSGPSAPPAPNPVSPTPTAGGGKSGKGGRRHGSRNKNTAK